MTFFKIIFPFIPLIFYLVLFFLTFHYQLSYIDDKEHVILNNRMASNLTLTGFSLTVITLIVSLYQRDLEKIFYPVFHYSLSIAYFLGSYIFLHLRIRRAFEYISDALTISGLWTIIGGLCFLFYPFVNLWPISLVFAIMVVIFFVFIIIDCILKYINSALEE